MISTPELLKGKMIPTSPINAIRPPPFPETIYLEKHLQREKKFLEICRVLTFENHLAKQLGFQSIIDEPVLS